LQNEIYIYRDKMLILSITGAVRIILILIGVFFIVRFLGRIFIAKRNIDDNERYNQNTKSFKEEQERSKKKQGKIDVVKRYRDAENVDYEEVEDEK